MIVTLGTIPKLTETTSVLSDLLKTRFQVSVSVKKVSAWIQKNKT